jgi:predicted O-methyltransferase YrrM
VLNLLLSKRKAPTSFLEIGVFTGTCGRAVEAARKVAVDLKIDEKAQISKRYDSVYELSSDDYFAQCDESFDLVFIDGGHTAEQSMRDFENAQNRLKTGGFIVLHDTNPATSKHLALDRCGDVWRTAVAIMGHPKLHGYTIDTESGLTVVQEGINPQPFTQEVADYRALQRCRPQALRLVSPQGWLKIMTGVE